MRWHAGVELHRDSAPTEEQAGRLAESLPGYGVTVHDRSRSRLTLRFEVEARTLGAAVDKALRSAKAASTAAFGEPQPEPCGVRVLTAEDHDQGLEETGVLDVIGFTEMGKLLGVSRQRVSQLAERDDFPRPLVPPRGRHGPQFSRTAVAEFAENWDRSTGRPRKTTTA
jgi:hypothetical protein